MFSIIQMQSLYTFNLDDGLDEHQSVQSLEPEYLTKLFDIKEEAAVEIPIIQIKTSECSCKKSIDSISDINNYEITDGTDNCAICRISNTEPCVGCIGTDCKIVKSCACCHLYHFHCIEKWFSGVNKSCPICSTEWKLKTGSIQNIIVSLGTNIATFETGTTLAQIYNHFSVTSDTHRLFRNKKLVEEISGDAAGTYSLCTPDSHTETSVIQVTLVDCRTNTFKEAKIHIKLHTKINQLRNNIGSLFNILSEKIGLFFKDTELTSVYDNFTVFNVGLVTDSNIMVKLNSNYGYKIHTHQSFVLAYVPSTIIEDSTDMLRNMIMGKISWYPMAYRKNIPDGDMCNLLCSLYMLIFQVKKSPSLIASVLDIFATYIDLYFVNSDESFKEFSLESLRLLLELDNKNFKDYHRSQLTMTFYELIKRIKKISGIDKSDTKILSETNVFCGLLLDQTQKQLINWTYAKKNIQLNKIFNIHSPSILSGLLCPLMTYDDNLQISIYINKGKDATHSVTLYQPLNDVETNVDPAKLGKKVSENITIEDNRIYDEALIVLIDTSSSMNSCSDFDEDIKQTKKRKKEIESKHYEIWNQYENLESDDRSLKNALIWFITHPSIKNWSNNYGCLKNIVCREQYYSPNIARTISKHRTYFNKILNNQNILVDGIIYSRIRPMTSYINIPKDFICPITDDIMTDPVILDDGNSYEKNDILKWLSKSKKSPTTNQATDGKIIANRALKSTINEWKTNNPQNKILEQDDLPELFNIRIMQEHLSDIIYKCTSDDSNIYDIMYFLYTVHDLSSCDYTLKNSEGFKISPTIALNSIKSKSILLNKIAPVEPFQIKIIDGCVEAFHNKNVLNFTRSVNIHDLAYSLRVYDFDLCFFYENVVTSGDNMYSASSINSSEIKFSSDKSIHLFEETPEKSKISNIEYFTRLDIVKKLFDAFINRSIAYSFNQVIGLMSFNDTNKLVCPLTPLYENFREKMGDLKAKGGTALYDCIFDGINHLETWKNADMLNRSKAKLRLICLSDGNDSGISKNSLHDVSKLLKAKEITLDCIVIGDSTCVDKLNSLVSGYMFNPTSITSAHNIVELETMIFSGERGSVSQYNKLIKETSFPPMLTPKKMGMNSIHYDSIKIKNPTTRIQKELLNVIENKHPDIDVYVNDHDITFWKIVLAGPSGTPYAGGNFLIYVSFGPEYPNVAPEMRFITPIKHCNINSYGKICHSIFDRNYISTVSVMKILQNVYGLLLAPDVTDPLNTTLAFSYYEATGKYEGEIIEHVGIHAKKSRNEWKKELVRY